jgi:hypothetical protein
MCLRDKAVGWFEGLTEDGIDTDNWDTVRAEFLENYEPKYSAKTTCANFTDLTQRSEETINDYTYHVQMAYKGLTDKKTAAMAVVRVNIPAGATEAEIKAEGVTNAFKFIKHQLFLAGLKDGIRDKVLEAAKETFTESVKVTRNLETIQNDHKRSNRISAIKQELEEEQINQIIWEDLTDDQLGQLAALRFQQKRINQPRPTTVRNPNTICRYCKKKGHLQKDCFSRKRNKAPMVDANGKPYQNQNQNNRINNVPSNPPLLLPPNQSLRPATRTPSSAQSPTSARITI